MKSPIVSLRTFLHPLWCLNPHYLAAPCRGKQTPAVCQEQSISWWSSIAGLRDEYYTLSYRGVSGCLVPLGTYRVQVAGRGHPSPPITRSDIQANILPLPVIPSSRVCCKRKVHVRVHVNGAYSIVQPPGGRRESCGKRCRRAYVWVATPFSSWCESFDADQCI